MITLNSISKYYETEAGVVSALVNINLSIGESEFISIMGQSGSGKSTLMNIIGCVDRPSKGQYLIDNIDVGTLSDSNRSRLRGKLFGFVFQSYNLLPRLSAIEQVELPLLYQQIDNRKERAIQALISMGLSDRIHHTPNQLSGGEQQRVAIARSLVVNPKIILADEPTGALDTKTGLEVMRIFNELVQKQGISVIIITHESNIAEQTNRIIRISDGKIIEDTDKIVKVKA
ncbi:MAG: macrolide ABC transporter ATP-binding protein [Chloroflexi bacterium]|nr:macrolide ABC transporter ATP-binding protein [Chloroflexota bacterium]